MESDHLLVFRAFRAVIEANHHPKIVKIGPTFYMNKVSNFKCDALGIGGRCGDNAALCQIAHNLAQTNSDAVEIIGVVRCVADQMHRVRIGRRLSL
jgi:hypothetical protein